MTESAKATPPSQENPYPPVISYPGPFNSSAYPPPGPPSAYPPFFPYPPPPDGTHTEGAQNGGPPGPYMMYAPPGVMYAYPHTQPQGILHFNILTYFSLTFSCRFRRTASGQPCACNIKSSKAQASEDGREFHLSPYAIKTNYLFFLIVHKLCRSLQTL